MLRDLGFTVRLCVMMLRGEGYVSTPGDLERVLGFCREHDVAQLSVRPIRTPARPLDMDAATFVESHGVSGEEVDGMRAWVRAHGDLVLRLAHGAEVYDVGGQNICLTDCLTPPRAPDEIRTLIFYSDGRLTYDWQHEGAVLLSGAPRARSETTGGAAPVRPGRGKHLQTRGTER